ncbi:MAG: hypothetical protein ACFFCO_01685 [Promethearchaeota archaeon]
MLQIAELFTGPGLAALGAVLAAGLGALGAAIGIGTSGSAMIGAVAERPETFSKGMIAVVLAEALGIYGLLAAFMILMRIPNIPIPTELMTPDEAVIASITGMSQGLIALASGLAIGVAAVGAGIGIGKAGSSMCTSLTEAPESFSKALVSVVLAEALGIYGLLASFMLLMRIDTALYIGQGIIAISAALAIGLAAVGAGLGIAKSGASLCKSLVRAPETFSKGLVSVVLAEALGIYGLLASFMLLMRIDTATALAQGYLAMAAGFGVGLAALGAGMGIASGGAALSDSLVEAPETFSKGLVTVVLAEALGIYGLLASFMLLMRIDSPSIVNASAVPVDVVGSIPQGFLGIAAGLAIGLAAIGAGYGIARAGASLCRSLTTAPEAFSKGLVSVVLAEALGIYGLLLSFMLIMRLGEGITDMSQAFMGIGAGLAIGLSCVGAGFGIALAGESLSRSVAEAPESFSKGLVSVVLAEALGIYGLLIGFMVVMRIDGAAGLPDAFGAGWLAVASGLAIALAAIGGGVGIGYGGAALCSSLRTAPESFSKGLVSVVLAEALGIYGLLASFMLVMRIEAETIAAMIGISAALTIGIGALVAGVAIGWAGASMIGAMVGKPEVFSKSMVPVVLAEALAIYTLLVAFMLIMRV